MSELAVGVIISPMEFKKITALFLLVILGVFSVIFSACQPFFSNSQSLAVAAEVGKCQPWVPIDQCDATRSSCEVACYVSCHRIAAINSQTNSLNQELKCAIAVNASSFTEIDLRRESLVAFFPPRLAFEPFTIQKRLASLGVFIS